MDRVCEKSSATVYTEAYLHLCNAYRVREDVGDDKVLGPLNVNFKNVDFLMVE